MTAPEIRIAAASATIALLLACDSESQPDLASVSTDSAGIRIVHSHPASSDAACTISAEPTVRHRRRRERREPVVCPGRGRGPDVRRIHRGGRPWLQPDPGLRRRWPAPAHDGQAGRGTRGIRERSLPDVDRRRRHDLGRRLFPLALQPLQRGWGVHAAGGVSIRSSSIRRWAEACWPTATPSTPAKRGHGSRTSALRTP